MQLCSPSIALTAPKATLERSQGRAGAELRQFSAGNDVRAVALSAFDGEL